MSNPSRNNYLHCSWHLRKGLSWHEVYQQELISLDVIISQEGIHGLSVVLHNFFSSEFKKLET